MKKTIDSLIESICAESGFLGSIAALRDRKGESRLFGDAVRPLTEHEIALLTAQGNHASDWKSIRVAKGFVTEHVAGTMFMGACVLGVFDAVENKADGLVLPCGIYKSTIIDSEIGNACSIYNAGMIARYVVQEGTVIVNTQTVSASGKCMFGNGRPISVGIETGGREIRSFAEITLPIASAVAMNRSETSFLKKYDALARSYAESCCLPFGSIGRGCIIRDTIKIMDSCIGEGALIDGALLVENCTVLSSQEEKTEISHGAFMRNSCAQWGCAIRSMAIVDESILTEHSHVERHGKVTHSIIGPNTGVAEGEVTSCLLGPFVGFHHQSLLIATLWPEGKGNVAYGANIGSNHTSKAPDQELWAGEGMFFGLGANIKFPSDFMDAPYSIIATGVDALPQRMTFPFSLINKPSRPFEGISQAYNELFPAWVLSENMYAVMRNEGKYKKRNKARRTVFVFDVFRKEIIEKMAAAMKVLLSAPEKSVYTEKDIPGIGKNFVTRESRKKAVDAYGFYCTLYALGGLKKRVSELMASGVPIKKENLFGAPSHDEAWDYQKQLLEDSGFDRRSIKENLAAFVAMQEQVAASVLRSKEKDDIRGKAVIRDYQYVNTLAADDSFITDLRKTTNDLKEEVAGIIKSL
jgi:hypothetical protein